MNADKVVSGVGGEIIGYNLYSYCFNNPVNMYDPSGQRPVVVDELVARSKYTVSWITRTVVSPLKALQVSVGMGIGLGASGEISVNGVDVGIGAVSSITDSVSYDKGTLDIKNTTSTNVGVTNLDAFEVAYSNGKEHSFFDANCTCSILHDPFVKQSACPANKSFQQVDSMIGFSFSVYLGIGFDISVGIDFRAWCNELIDIFDAPYTN